MVTDKLKPQVLTGIVVLGLIAVVALATGLDNVASACAGAIGAAVMSIVRDEK